MTKSLLGESEQKVVIVLATMNGIPESFCFLAPESGAEYIVVNQGSRIETQLAQNVLVTNDHGIGLARSRNIGIELAPKGSIVVISDNDVKHSDDLLVRLREAYAGDFDVVTFNNADSTGPIIQSRDHSWLSIMGIPSWCISFKKSDDFSFRFDELFGLGATFNSGEENIFLLDMYRSGLKLAHIGFGLVSHEGVSTGYIFDDLYFMSKGAMIHRMFGWIGMVLLPIFWARKAANAEIGVLSALRLMCLGFFKHHSGNLNTRG